MSGIFSAITDKGSIEFEATSGNCVGCKAKGGGMVGLTVHAIDRDTSRLILCGNCIALSLGSSVGSRALLATLRRLKGLLDGGEVDWGDLSTLVDDALARWEGT